MRPDASFETSFNKKARDIVRRGDRRITDAKPISHPRPVSVEVLRFAIYKNMLEELEEFANEVPNTLMADEVLELRKFIRESRNILIFRNSIWHEFLQYKISGTAEYEVDGMSRGDSRRGPAPPTIR